MATQFTIRPARKREAPFLTELCIRSKAHWGYDAAFMAAAAPALRISESEIGSGAILVAIACGDTLACGVVGLAPLPRPHWCEISHLFVAPERFGHGAGRALFDAAAALAAERGARYLSILADPNAVAFYEKLGARRCGEAPSDVIPNRMLPLYEFTIPRRQSAAD